MCEANRHNGVPTLTDDLWIGGEEDQVARRPTDQPRPLRLLERGKTPTLYLKRAVVPEIRRGRERSGGICFREPEHDASRRHLVLRHHLRKGLRQHVAVEGRGVAVEECLVIPRLQPPDLSLGEGDVPRRRQGEEQRARDE